HFAPPGIQSVGLFLHASGRSHAGVSGGKISVIRNRFSWFYFFGFEHSPLFRGATPRAGDHGRIPGADAFSDDGAANLHRTRTMRTAQIMTSQARATAVCELLPWDTEFFQC